MTEPEVLEASEATPPAPDIPTEEASTKEAKAQKEDIRPNRATRRGLMKNLHLPARLPLVGVCLVCRLPFLGTAQARCQCKAGKSKAAYIRIG